MQSDKTKLIDYLKEGYSLIPVDMTSDGGIYPKIKEWETRKQVFENNLTNWNVNSWGLITGSLSNNLEVIDFDEKYKIGIYKLWVDALPEDAKKLLKTLPISKSKSNGFHVHYTCKTIQGNLKLAKRKVDNKTTIETRGEGGFVFEYPTKGYEYIQHTSSDIKEITPEQRMIFLNTARSLTEIDEIEKIEELPKVYTQSSSDLTPWFDYNNRTTWSDILLPHGWTLLHSKGEEKYWKRPGKKKNSASATTNYKGLDLLHVFSSSSEIPSEKSYNKFQIYAMLEHNNNFSLAAKELIIRGYGKKSIKVATKPIQTASIVTNDTKEELLFHKSSDIKSKPIDWLWKGKIAKGKITIIAGEPGLGKSQVSLYLASVVSNGGNFPGGYSCNPGTVLLFSAEDAAADTINPRLQALGANGEKIFIFHTVSVEKGKQKAFDIKNDLQLLSNALKTFKDTSLIVIDPITAFLGETDSNSNSEVRELLRLLSELAEEHNVAMLIVSHPNKSTGGSIMNKIMGSLGFVAAARAVYMVIKDKENSDRRLMLNLKNNIAIDKGGFAYRLEGVDLGHEITTSKVVWEKEEIQMTLQEAISDDDGKEKANKESVKWLEDFLGQYKDGVSFDIVMKEATKQKIGTRRTMDRAAEELWVEKIYQGKGKSKIWKLDLLNDVSDEVVEDALKKF